MEAANSGDRQQAYGLRMDDQRADRESGGVTTYRARRIRIGLRLMLLVVALFCVCCAYYRASSDLRRLHIERELISLDSHQRFLAGMVKHNANVGQERRDQLAKVRAEIAEKKRVIGEK